MDTIKFNKGTTLMVAHRGLSGIERENTNVAFTAAANRSYYGIETDVYHTADGKFILLHDGNTARVSKVNLNAEASTFDELRSVMLTDRDGSDNRNDIRLPELSEYIKICHKYGKIAILELKSTFSNDELVQIIDMFKALDYESGLIAISFNLDNLVRLKTLFPNITVQFLTGNWSDNLIAELKKYRLDLDIAYGALTEERVKELHDNGIKVNCWTCDNAEHGERLAAWGVDYITSNILE